MVTGVVGCGKSGLSFVASLKEHGEEVVGYDINPTADLGIRVYCGKDSKASSISELCKKVDVIVACVPTPEIPETGECDLSILDSVIDQVAAVENDIDNKCEVFVQRSTCPPGTADSRKNRFKFIQYAVNPDPLSARLDFTSRVNPCRIAYAGSSKAIDYLRKMYRGFTRSPKFESDNMTLVEMLDYIESCTNSVLETLWREYYEIVQSIGLNHDDLNLMIRWIFETNALIRGTVRNPGTAFFGRDDLKELTALVHLATSRGMSVSTLKGAVATKTRIETSEKQ
jgi:UDP-N-acetyl-D-mannosaminuronate dehydrogenase